MDPLTKIKPATILDFVPGSHIGETARFFGLSVAPPPPPPPHKPVAMYMLAKNTRYISPPATMIVPKNIVTPARIALPNRSVTSARRTLKLPNNHDNLHDDPLGNFVAERDYPSRSRVPRGGLNTITKNHKSKVNTRRRR